MGAFFPTNTRHYRTVALLCRFGLLLILLFGNLTGFAASQPSDPQALLRQVENRFYLTQYDKDSVEKRLDRIEKTVFGQAQSSLSVPERIAKLDAVVNLPADAKATKDPLQPLKPTPAQPQQAVRNTPAQQPVAQNPAIPPDVLASMQTAPATEESDYPAVSEMEQKVFGKIYPKDDLSARLDRLELAVFKTKNPGELSDRTDGLRLAVLGDTTLQQRAQTAYQSQNGGLTQTYNAPLPANYNPYNPATPNPAAYQPSYQQPPAYQPVYSYPSGGQPGAYEDPNRIASSSSAYYPSYSAPPGSLSPDFYAALLEVEDKVLKQTYAQEPVNMRLDRLETNVFGTPSPEMGEEDRLHRVISVAAAGGHTADSATTVKSTIKSMLPIFLMILPLLLL